MMDSTPVGSSALDAHPPLFDTVDINGSDGGGGNGNGGSGADDDNEIFESAVQQVCVCD